MIRLAPVALLLVAVVVGFGSGTSAAAPGTCRIHTSGTQRLDTALPDGSVVLVWQGRQGGLHLRRVLPDCSIAASALIARPKPVALWAIAATPDGQILLGGSYGRSALVGRFFADGGLDHSFGTNGWTRVTPREHPVLHDVRPGFGVTSIAVWPSGTIVLGGTDGSAHCCIQSFVSELAPDGRPIATFGHGGSRVIPRYAGSYTADVFPNPDRSVYVLDQYEQSGCGAPSIVRVFTDGSLDRRFDGAILRTIRGLTRPRFRFTPSLVPDGRGAFSLVGGFDRTCATGRGSSGLSVRIGPSGQVVGGLTHFRSPRYAFDSPTAIRLPSGRILAAGPGVTSTLVQVFGPDGSRDPAVGDHGLLRFGAPPGVHDRYPGVDLLSGADGGAWLVTGFPHEIDLTPIPVR